MKLLYAIKMMKYRSLWSVFAVTVETVYDDTVRMLSVMERTRKEEQGEKLSMVILIALTLLLLFADKWYVFFFLFYWNKLHKWGYNKVLF